MSNHSIRFDLRSLALGVTLVVVPWALFARNGGASAGGGWGEILEHMRLVDLDDGRGGLARTLRIEGLNVQVVNGEGSTEETNAVGNVIVGYNDARSGNGSHNVVSGCMFFRSYGGFGASASGWTEGPYCSVFGGVESAASGAASTTCGGWGSADGQSTLAAGCGISTTLGERSATFGGGHCSYNRGVGTVLLGGDQNRIEDANATTVVGGEVHRGRGRSGLILGGRSNTFSSWPVTSVRASAIASRGSHAERNGVTLGCRGANLEEETSIVGCGVLNRTINESYRWSGGNCHDCDRNE